MELIYKKSFIKEARKLPLGYSKKLEILLNELKSINDITEFLGDIVPMDNSYYRIRLGTYRIGIQVIKPEIICFTILSRGDIYKHFPPK